MSDTKPALLPTALKMKCPYCGEGDLFKVKNPYRFSTMHVMHDACPKCHTSFHEEPGFYWGAMYVSYALTAGMVVFNTVWIYLTMGFNMWAHIIVNVAMIIGLSPLSFRISRALWLASSLRYFKKN